MSIDGSGNKCGKSSYDDIVKQAIKARELLSELVPDADWDSIDEPMWIIAQLGDVLSGAINLEIIESFMVREDPQGLLDWYRKIDSTARDYALIRDVYDRYLSVFFGGEKE